MTYDLFKGARNRAVGQAIAAPGAFVFNDFETVMDILHLRVHGALGADFAAKSASDAERLYDSYFHAEPPNARLGSGAQGLSRKSKTSSIGF